MTRESAPALDRLVHYAVRYYHDFVKPTKRFRAPDAVEREALEALDAALGALPPDADARRSRRRSTMSAAPSSATRRSRSAGPDGRPGVALTWFSTLYELLLGQERGPRFGSFVAIYGIPETRALIGKALAGELAQPPAATLRRLTAGPAVAPEAELRRRARSFSASAKRFAVRFAQPCATSHSEMSSPPTTHVAGSGMSSAPAGTSHSMARPRMKLRSAARAMRPHGQAVGAFAAASLELRRRDAGEADLAVARLDRAGRDRRSD